MTNDAQKGVVGLLSFMFICGVLAVVQNSFLPQFAFRGQLPLLILSFTLTDLYFRKESYLVDLFRAGVAAFFLSIFSVISWPVFLAATVVTISFFRLATSFMRKRNIITFSLIALISLLFYYQLSFVILFLERNRIRLITINNIISSLLTLFCSLFFYFFYVQIAKIKEN